MNNKGQNVIEYILLVVAVLTVFILFLNPQGSYRQAIDKTVLNGTTTLIENLNNELQFPPPPS